MNTKVEVKEYRFDMFKWFLVAALVVGSIVANSYYSEVGLLYRVLALVAVMLVAVLIAVNTATGASFWELMKASQVELRKVVWPSTQEVNQTTLLVVGVVLITAIILWGLDALIGFGAGKLY